MTRRLRRHDPHLLVEAALALALAAALIAILPFRRLAGTLSPPLAVPRRPCSGDVERLPWAVDAAARRVPWRTVCFQKGLALHWMLRRRGLPSQLHYGVGRDWQDRFGAHVWVSLDGEILIGGAEAPRFAEVARFPGAARA